MPVLSAMPHPSGYGNRELSADRANAARRLVSGSGVGAAQVAEVRGFADQMPWNTADPEDPRNRRISVVVKFAYGRACRGWYKPISPPLGSANVVLIPQPALTTSVHSTFFALSDAISACRSSHIRYSAAPSSG